MISKPLPDMSPVFLLHMSIIVLMIGSASSKLYGLLSLMKVLHQVPIQKLRAVIAVKPEQREWQRVFNILDLLEDLGFTFAPDCSLFSPAGPNIHGVDRIGKLAQKSLPAMGDGIGLQEPWFLLIPLVGLNRDLFSQESARFSRASPPALIFHSARFEKSIQGGG